LEALKILLSVVVREIGRIKDLTWKALHEIDRGEHILNLVVFTENPYENGEMNMGHNLELARKLVLTEAYDYMFNVESDVVPPRNCLLELLKMSTDVAFALVPDRPCKIGSDDFVACMNWNGNPHARNSINKLEIFEIKGNTGTGCFLITRKALEIVGFPLKIGIDFVWSDELHKKGIKMLCNPNVLCQHVDENGKAVRSKEWCLDHWRNLIKENAKQRRDWYYGLPYSWWYGMEQDAFLSELEKHMENELGWVLY
jgi:GT2 family glycosyltransferase